MLENYKATCDFLKATNESFTNQLTSSKPKSKKPTLTTTTKPLLKSYCFKTSLTHLFALLRETAKG